MIVDAIREVTNIYDIMAICCVYLLNEIESTGYSIWDYDENSNDDIFDMIERYNSNIKERGHKISLRILVKELEKELCDKGITPDILWAIVSNIDRMVTTDIGGNKLFSSATIYEYQTLNNCARNEIRIIPKINDSLLLKDGEYILKDPKNNNHNLFRNRTECYCSWIDEATVNYMVWDKEKIDKYPFTIYHVANNSDIAKHYRDRRKIRIGIVPFSADDLKDILDIEFQNRTFHIAGMKEESQELLKNRYVEAYKKTIDKDVDFLIYPEMLMTETIIKAIDSEIENTENGPIFVVNGSIWKDKTNKSIVTDNMGNQIFTYFKKCAFNYAEDGKEYREDLDCTRNKEYMILEIDNIGRIGVCICKDIRDPEVALFHQYIDTDILLVPAFSSSLVLVSNARNMAENFNCITVFANSCSACSKKWKECDSYNIGFITMPAKNGTENSCCAENYGAEECHTTCNEKCSVKVFTLTFDEIKMYDDKISIQLESSSI